MLALLLLVPADPGLDFFEKKIRPLLLDQCVSCHDDRKARGGLRLDSPAAIRKGGDSGPLAGVFLKAIRHEDGVKPMPPKGKLASNHLVDLDAWAKMGYPLPKEEAVASPGIDWKKAREHWAFQPVKRTPGSIDRFIRAKLDGIAHTPEADKQTLLRRLSFHLTGLPPTPEQADSFDDPRPDAYERLVDDLLTSPAFGERWGRHWLDVARYAEDQAHTFAVKPSTFAWRYRDWVVQAFNADLPYDRFVKLQIAADLMGASKEDKAALGFFGLGAQYYKNTDAARAAADELDDRVDTFARGFLGLTVSCARCHDHKFDPIPTEDYYSIAGVFHSSKLADLPMAEAGDIAKFQAAKKKLDESDKAMKDFLKVMKIKPNEMKKLPADKQEQGKKLQAALDEAKKSMPPPLAVSHGIAESGSQDLKVHLRGDPRKLGAVAPRRMLRIVAGDERTRFAKGSGRLELAEAVADPRNPLTARVIVNRLWAQAFGRGIVGTPSNFGTLGDKPTHPELLDWLASELIESGWSLKHVHRLIVTSDAFKRSSTPNEAGEKRDPDNVRLWRGNRRRLEVEPWRDALLSASGQLDRTLGGPTGSLASSGYKRRTVYGKISRHELDGLLRLFDFPDANITSEKRTETTVPQQQLFVLNSPFFAAQAEALALRVQKDKDAVGLAHRLALGRLPTREERQLAEAFLGAKDEGGSKLSRWARYAQALLASNEFLHVD